MDLRRKEKIKSELKKAEEFLNSAEILQRTCLFNSAATMSYYSAFHAAAAAFLTVGFNNPQKEQFTSFLGNLKRYSFKLDGYIETLRASRAEWDVNTGLEFSEKESLLRMYQARDFLLEIKDFLRRSVKA